MPAIAPTNRAHACATSGAIGARNEKATLGRTGVTANLFGFRVLIAGCELVAPVILHAGDQSEVPSRTLLFAFWAKAEIWSLGDAGFDGFCCLKLVLKAAPPCGRHREP